MANRIKGITVEIGGDTTKLQTALQGVNKEIKNTQAQLKDVEKLLKLDPGNTELLAQKQKLLADAVSETKEKLETLKTAAQQAGEALSRGEISANQYDALQREIIETEQALKRLEEQANQSATAVQKVAAAGEKVKSAGDKMQSAGQALLPVTAAVTAMGTASVATAANFESSMSQVQATMGITKDAMSTLNGQSVNTMDALSDLAKEMGASTAFSATECAEALNYLALAGYDTQQMADTLPIVLNLAAAGGMDLASASDMVTDAMSALGMETSQAGTMVDQMAKTASSTNTSVAQLGEGILTIGATAKSVKGGTAELNTALGILANNGIKGAEGGTHLRNVILSLQNPTDKAAALMDALGVKVFDSSGNMRSMNDILGDLNKSMEGMTAEEKSNIIGKIFNKTDLSSVNALLANTGETWDSLQNSINNSAGAAQQMADTQLDNLQGQLTLLKSALEGLAISIGELIIPYVKEVVAVMQKVVDWLNGLNEGTKKIIITIALLAAALGPILIFVGKVLSAVGTIMTWAPKIMGAINAAKGALAALNAVMMANPIMLVIAAIAALVAAFLFLWNHCEGFRNFWINLWEGIKAVVMGAVDGIRQFLLVAWEGIKSAAEIIWNGIATFFSTIWTTISTVFTTAITAIGLFVTGAFTAIQEFFIGIWTAIYEVIAPLLEAFRYLFETIFQAIQMIVSGVMTAIQTKIQEIWNAIVAFLTPILEGIKNFFYTIWQGIQTVVTTVVDAAKTKITTVWNGIKEFLNTVLNAIKSVFFTTFNGIGSFITTIMNTIKSTVLNIWNSVKNGVTSTVNGIATAIRSGFDSAVNYIKGLIGQAFSWGQDMIMGIVNGIRSAVGAVADAVNGVANIIRSVLHFSVPDEGPLTDYESWMPDFMRGLAKGIEKSRGLITDAMAGVTSDLTLNPQVNSGALAMTAGGMGSNGISGMIQSLTDIVSQLSGQGGDILIPVYIGQDRIDEIVVTANQRANFRSGGR